MERESAKVAADLSAKLTSAELAKQEASAWAEDLEKQLAALKAENERLKEGPVRAIKRTGEEVRNPGLPLRYLILRCKLSFP